MIEVDVPGTNEILAVNLLDSGLFALSASNGKNRVTIEFSADDLVQFIQKVEAIIPSADGLADDLVEVFGLSFVDAHAVANNPERVGFARAMVKSARASAESLGRLTVLVSQLDARP